MFCEFHKKYVIFTKNYFRKARKKDDYWGDIFFWVFLWIFFKKPSKTAQKKMISGGTLFFSKNCWQKTFPFCQPIEKSFCHIHKKPFLAGYLLRECIFLLFRSFIWIALPKDCFRCLSFEGLWLSDDKKIAAERKTFSKHRLKPLKKRWLVEGAIFLKNRL